MRHGRLRVGRRCNPMEWVCAGSTVAEVDIPPVVGGGRPPARQKREEKGRPGNTCKVDG